MTRKLAYGDPAVEIGRAAGDYGHDLIAMATHGRGGLRRWVFGSVADKVIHASDLPLLIVRPKQAPPQEAGAIRHLVVPLDGSALAETAIPVAQALAARLHIGVSLVQAILQSAVLYDMATVYDPRLDTELEQMAKEYLHGVQGRFSQAGINAGAVVRKGSPAFEVLDYAEATPGALIVMTTHGLGGAARWVFGSVADRVMRAAAAPVLMLRSAREPA